MPLIEIRDPEDVRVAPYRGIRERDLVGRTNRFVAEGKVVLDVLLSSGRFEVESILVLDRRLAGLKPVLAKANASVPIYVADAAVIDAIAGFHLHRGILAVGLRRSIQSCSELIGKLPGSSLVVALVGISNHDNMGSIFRNAAAFGIDAVLLDSTCCDPLYRKAIRVSVGAALKVPFARADSVPMLVKELTRAGFAQFALTPQGTTDIRKVRHGGRTAIYLGAEGEGLPLPLLETLEGVRIPIKSDFDSLNVAAASAIALHHLSNC